MNDSSLYLLLTIVSVLALWAFLATLIAGLLLILKPLQAIRGHLQRIVAGVRAIEQETAPLLELSERLPAAAGALRASLDPLGRRIQALDQGLEQNHRRLKALRRS